MDRDWHELVSQPKYKVKTENDVFIRMRDGVCIAANIYRPESAGKFPVLLGLSPYGKDIQKLPVFEFPTDRELGNGGIESGDTEYFVSRGYVHVIADVRGTGLSGGAYRVFTTKEQEDGYDIVEWLAKQPWCDGNVGMLGISYFAMIQYLVAAQNPPHLKAIFPADGSTDMYRHWAYHGGILNIAFTTGWWGGSALVHTAEPVADPDGKIARMVEALRSDFSIRSYPTAYKTLIRPDINPHLFDVLVNPYDGQYYWERSSYTKFDKIKIPTYLLSRWTAWPIHLPGAFSAYREINAPKKLMITIPESGVGFNRPWHENHDIVLRWYDHWLKGIDTGIMDEPPIRILVQGKNQYRYENEWPLARTKWTKIYLTRGGLLSNDMPGWNERPDGFTAMPGLQPEDEIPSLKYTTEPLTDELELTGPSALYLYSSLNDTDGNWIVEVKDVDASGASKRVTIGWLRASHRELDESRSKPYQPFHPHTGSIPVEPGRVYKYAIELRETSYVFKPGHKIQLVIKGQDAPWEGRTYMHRISYHLPPSKQVRQTIYHTPEFPSHLLVPVIPK